MAASSGAQRAAAALRVALAVMLAACGVDAGACSIGSGIREQDLAQSYRASDEVFVARLTSYRMVVPAVGGEYMLRQSDYDLIEAIKDRPSPRGTLTEVDHSAPLSGNPPGPACGPWLIGPDVVGATALIMVSRRSLGGVEYAWVDPFSSRLDPAATSTDDDLELILRIHLNDANGS